LIGTTLKQYRVDEALGKGGMGEVYRAFDTKLQRPVALKILPQEYTADADRRGRFLQEARAAGSIVHPAIAQIYDVDEVDGVTFMAMELVDGRTVGDLVAAGELDVAGAVGIGVQVAQGLAKAHAAGIVHRDIKSDNIMVTADGHAKILDFGLAKLLEPPITGETPLDPAEMPTVAMGRTQVGMVMGTVAYMSPEQARGLPVDPRSDLFSLGIVLYHMASGQLPFMGHSPVDTLHAIAYEETRPVTQIRATLPRGLQRVISRCMRKQPDERYAAATELADALKQVQHEIETGISLRVPIAERIRDGLYSLRQFEPKQWGLALVGAVSAVALLIWVLFRWELPLVIMVAGGGWLAYRIVKNRPRKLIRRFATRLRKKMPEVRLIVVHDRHVTIVVDALVARIPVRVNSQLDRLNDRWFHGEKFTARVRDDVSAEELRELLQDAGVLFVRDDLLEERL